MSKIIVVVDGGSVTDVYTDNEEVDVEILDYDVMKFFDKESDDPQYLHMIELEKETEAMTIAY